ncbi:MAG TPA: prefoldin subunit alpha [archaeon]|nr:prefoldin subunit alpha [archaeon]
MTEHHLTEQQLIQMAQQEEKQLNNRQQTLIKITEVIKETNGAMEALKEIKKQKGTYLVKLGAGIFIESEIKTNICKKSFAEDGYIDENIEETIKMLEKRKEDLEKQAQKVNNDLIKVEQRLSQIVSIIQQLQNEKRKNFSKATKQ